MSNNPSKDWYNSIQHFVHSGFLVSQLYDLDQVYLQMNYIANINPKNETIGMVSL